MVRVAAILSLNKFFNIFNRANFNPPTDNLEAIDATGAPIPGFGQPLPRRRIHAIFSWR